MNEKSMEIVGLMHEFNLAKIRQDEYKKIIGENAYNLPMITEDDARHALVVALQCRKLSNTLEEKRVEDVKPHLEQQRVINQAVKWVKTRLNDIEQHLQDKIEKWIKLEEDNPFYNFHKLEVDEGTLSKKTEAVHEVEDLSKIPLEYLCVNEDAVKKAIKSGVRTIPGMIIYYVESTAIRLKN
jgi:hypothetical protein